MAQHDYVIANGTGAAVRSDLNNALAAIVTNNSGSTEPTTTYAYQWWADTTAGQLKLRDSSNSSWIVIQELDGTMLMEDGAAATPGLAFATDLDTGFFRAGANQLGIATNGVERVEFGTTEVVFNDGGNDIDFRIEGDTNANLFFVDAGNDRIGLGTSSPQAPLVVSNSGAEGIEIQPYRADFGTPLIQYYNRSTSAFLDVTYRANSYRFNNGSAEVARIDSSGRLGIGDTAPDALLVIKGNSDSNTTPSIRLKDGTDTREAWITNASGDLSLNVGGDDDVPHGTLKLFEGGTLTYAQETGERFRCDTSGRLLVGTSSASYSTRAVFQGNSAGSGFGAKVHLALDANGQSLSSGNNVGGLLFSNNAGDQFASIVCDADGTTGSGDYPGRLVFSTTADGASSPTERMRITQSGSLYVFSTAFSTLLSTAAGSGTTDSILVGTHSATAVNTGTTCFRVTSNGDVANTNNSYGAISDIKLKENIVDAESQWSDIKAIQVRKYNFKEETGQQTHTQLGVVAQEVELVSPGLVSESPDRDGEGNDLGTTTKSVNYSVLYMKAVKALQEAMERIETLEAKVAALEAQ